MRAKSLRRRMPLRRKLAFSLATLLLFFTAAEIAVRIDENASQFWFTLTEGEEYWLIGRAPLVEQEGNELRLAKDFSKTFRYFCVPATKEPNTVRIVAIGGSTVFGHDATGKLDCGFPERLQERFEPGRPGCGRVEVINLGAPGLLAAQVRDFVPDVLRLQPDVVILSIGQNEFNTALQDLRNQQLEEPPSAESCPLHFWGLLRWWAEGLHHEVAWKDVAMKPEEAQVAAGKYRAALRQLLACLQQEELRVYVCGLLQRDEDPSEETPASSFNALLREESGLANATFVDLPAVFLGSARRDGVSHASLFSDSVHPSGCGYDLIAETLEARLRADLALEPKRGRGF